MSPPLPTPAKAALLLSLEGAPVPLLGVAVSARVFGAHARVVVRQRYRNDEARPIEAVYTFPVPSDAALVGFAMEAAGRRIEAVVKEREEAFREYDEALWRGHGAALLDEERKNVFTTSVGNLLPGEETVVEVVYVQPLAADEGALRFVVPTLVAPRYVPGTPAGDRTGHGRVNPTDRVPDADRITPAVAAVDYGLTLDVVVDLGRAITVESPSHALVVAGAGGHALRVSLRQSEAPLDRDVVIVAAGAPGVAAGVVAERRAGQEGTFALTVVPDLFDPSQRAPRRDVVFVVDVSGSMAGASLHEAKRALHLCLRHLAEGDRFHLIAFSDELRAFDGGAQMAGAPSLLPFTQRTLQMADAWVDALEASGGTEMLGPLLAAAAALEGPAGRDRILVLLTDGQVGNEAEIARTVAAHASGARIFTFGIGTNVSDLLLRDLARRTGGAVELIHPGERIDEKVTTQLARATAARVEGVTLRWIGIAAGELAPAPTSPLVDGEPWVVFGRYAEPGVGRAELRGKLRGEPFFLEVPVELPAEAEREGLTALWATARIRELEAAEPELSGRRAVANRERIVKLSTEHRVASKHTSFVLVEERSGDRRAHGQPATRPVPVSAPAGWATGYVEVERGAFTGASTIVRVPRGLMVQASARARADEVDRSIDPSAELLAEEVGLDSLEAYSPPLAAPAVRYPACAPAPMPEDRIAALFAKQLASGLWEGEDGTEDGRLLATARALEDCADNRIDTTHPLYGPQVKKAVEALCALADKPSSDAPTLAAALVAALKVATGKRVQAQVREAIVRANLGRRMGGALGPS